MVSANRPLTIKLFFTGIEKALRETTALAYHKGEVNRATSTPPQQYCPLLSGDVYWFFTSTLRWWLGVVVGFLGRES